MTIPEASADGPGPPPTAYYGTVGYGPEVGTETSDFWGVAIDGAPTPDDSTLSSLLNATPIHTLRFGADWSDEENWTYSRTFSGCFYNDDRTCGSIQNNVSQFATLCGWLTSGYCILGLPAEINNPVIGAYFLSWLQSTLGWEPNCVAIGNEPPAWTNYDLPWSSWSSTNSYSPSAAHLGDTVTNYTKTLRHDFPGICIIGLEASTNYVSGESEISAISGDLSNVSQYAFHLYPTSTCSGSTTASNVLTTSKLTKIATAYTDYFSPDAGGAPVAVHEFNLGGTTCGTLIQSYTGAVFASATIAEALALGIPDVTYFHFYCGGAQCMYDSSTGTSTPTYDLYSGLFTHMDINVIHNATLSSGVTPNTYAVVGYAPGPPHYTDYSVLVSNANPTLLESLSLAGLLNSTCQTSMTAYYQTPGKDVWSYSLGSNDTIELPDQSSAVVDWDCYQPPSPPP